MLSVPTDTNEIMVLGTSFVSILHGKTKISNGVTSFAWSGPGGVQYQKEDVYLITNI